MVFLRRVFDAVIVVVLLKVLMPVVCRPAGRVHVWWIKNNGIKNAVPIRKLQAIHSALKVRRMKIIFFRFDLLPEHSITVGYVSDLASFRHIQLQNIWKHFVVCPNVRRKNEIICGDSFSDSFCFLLAQVPRFVGLRCFDLCVHIWFSRVYFL